MDKITLYDYWRSSASYRVRIALNLKGLEYETVVVNLLTAEHKAREYTNINPQAIVPAIVVDGRTFTQSLAIIEYLDNVYPQVPLLASDPVANARIRALSYAIAMEIHPICNLSVAMHVADLTGGGDQAKRDWMNRFIGAGLESFESCLGDRLSGTFCHGDSVSMADCCLVPQLYNAKRWGVDYSGLEKICAIEEACGKIGAFYDAYPDRCRQD